MDTMLGKVVRMIVVLSADRLTVLGDLLEKIGDSEVFCELKKFLRRQPCWTGEKVVTEQLKPVPAAVALGTDIWRKVYQKLGLEKEFEGFAEANPENSTEGFWNVPVIKGATMNKVVAVLRELDVNIYLYNDDLDAVITKNDRDPSSGSYRVRFAANVEADAEFANQSAKQLTEGGVKGITLLERLLLELAYFIATNKHLDTKNATLCSGSRDSGGRVPYVGWYSDFRKVYVCWYYVDRRDADLRSRPVVS